MAAPVAVAAASLVEVKAEMGVFKFDGPITYYPTKEYTHDALTKLSQHPGIRPLIEQAKDAICNFSGLDRPLVEDMLVRDAAAVYLQQVPPDKVIAHPLYGGSLIVNINVDGTHPDRVIWSQVFSGGMRRCDFKEGVDLLYRPRNIVHREYPGSRYYGISPLEEIAERFEKGHIPRHEMERAFGLLGGDRKSDARMFSFLNWARAFKAEIQERCA